MVQIVPCLRRCRYHAALHRSQRDILYLVCWWQLPGPDAVVIPEESADGVKSDPETLATEAAKTTSHETTRDAYAATERIGALTWASRFYDNMKCNFRALWEDTKNPIARTIIVLATVLAAPVALAITGLLMGMGVIRSTARCAVGCGFALQMPCTDRCCGFLWAGLFSC